LSRLDMNVREDPPTDDPQFGSVDRQTGFRRKVVTEGDAQDKQLISRAVARAKEGDRDALRFLYVRYADAVYGYVRSIVRDDHDAEDVTQQVFLKLMRAIGKYEERAVPFSAWILRVARNLAVDHVRQRRAVPCEEVRGAGTRADETAADRGSSLREALGALPEEQRNVVMLRHLVGLSPGEIADRMGKSEGSIHGLHHRGRRALRTSLANLEARPATSTVRQ
jgi:RNA polymerase sigma-70 factor (ECF subfamily)